MKIYLIIAAISGTLSVMLGAFAAHGLKSQLSESLLNAFKTGVEYQMIHSLALILFVILYRLSPSIWLQYGAGLLVAGIILFSGSLYALSLTQFKWFGPITPIGGVCFILAWTCLVVAAVKQEVL